MREFFVGPLVPVTAAAILALGLASGSRAQDSVLPDIGSSAAELLSPQEESEYGAYTLYQLRRYGYVLEDPLIDDWLDSMGHRLAAASDRPKQDFTFFMMRDRQINAFATLGGYVGVNAGLILTAQNEDEVAGVIAHEISHVTQRHVLRAVERAKKDQLPIMLATLGAVIAAQQSGARDMYGNRNNTDAIQAAIVGGQALAAQRQIDYTRSNEAEADRIGIQTLHRSGYNVDGMADFFERMDKVGRGNSGGYNVPSYLRTHPVTTTRLSEARERAARLQREPATFTSTNRTPLSPLLPQGLNAVDSGTAMAPVRMFSWARERLRVLSAENPHAALKEYQSLIADAGPKPRDDQRYGLALAQMQANHPAVAEASLQELAKSHPDNLWVALALAENAHVAKNDTLSRKRYEDILARYPVDRAASLSYARTLNAIGSREAGQRAQAVLRPILATSAEDPLFQQSFGRASELAGDIPRAGEAYAEAAFLNGRAEDALSQFNATLKRSDIDYIQRARIEARIAAITPIVLEIRRRGLKPQDQPTDQS